MRLSVGNKRILFVSGSIGLGHAIRDIAIATELRRYIPSAEIFWLAAPPGDGVLEEAGENLLPEAAQFADDSTVAEDAADGGFRLNLLKYLSHTMGAWKKNVNVFREVVDRDAFDLIIADEAYEISMAIGKGLVETDAHFIMIYDFFGNVSMSRSPIERLINYMWNRQWATAGRHELKEGFSSMFIGEPQDVPEKKLGFLLPSAREVAQERCEFLGYVLPFTPEEYADQSEIKAELGYGNHPLVVCSIGGTAVGGELLQLCTRAHPIIREKIPDIQMVLVCGPRLSPKSLEVPEGIEVRGYVPALYKHLAASDLAIVQAGGTTTTELTALRKPFLYFPLEGHFEQRVHVAERLKRHRAGVEMDFQDTTPSRLAEMVIENISKKVDYASIPVNGAEKAAQIIERLL